MDSARIVTKRRLLVIGAMLGLTAASLVVGVAVVLLLSATVVLGVGLELSNTGALILSLIGIQGIAFPTVGYVYLRYHGRAVLEFVPTRVPSLRDVGVIVGGWIGALGALLVVANLVLAVSDTAPAQNQAAQTVAENPEFVPFLLPFVFLLNGPGEEFLYRGVIQGRFREDFSAPAAIVLATLMFAPIHIFSFVEASPQAALLTISLLTVPSLVFGAVYEYTDNFVVPALVHGLYNATLFGGIYLSNVVG
ncbi:CPBP family intramembrane glutamic endopeptidase [Halorientalis pallida]|uniref:CPBP family intramembrane metalloprotease n=1 Tax=Halorientalis pallida TaxID=2479928 RepID=A0A498KYU6_9EURY|nr:type II CAAX endopeptidase family protein [Halorientalis pallida]RXK50539.1 CPBP family intramembrane metalloprotease [Halorientalis pallida]